MAEESELVGGISVTLGASDTKLISDLDRAEALVQNWAKQQAEVVLRARFQGGTGGGAPVAAAAADSDAIAKAIQEGFAGLSTRPAARRSPHLVSSSASRQAPQRPDS